MKTFPFLVVSIQSDNASPRCGYILYRRLKLVAWSAQSATAGRDHGLAVSEKALFWFLSARFSGAGALARSLAWVDLACISHNSPTS